MPPRERLLVAGAYRRGKNILGSDPELDGLHFRGAVGVENCRGNRRLHRGRVAWEQKRTEHILVGL